MLLETTNGIDNFLILDCKFKYILFLFIEEQRKTLQTFEQFNSKLVKLKIGNGLLNNNANIIRAALLNFHRAHQLDDIMEFGIQ